MYFGRFLMENDPFKHRAPREEDKAFRALIGCCPVVVLDLWNKLIEHDALPENGTMLHLLWTLMYSKQYAKWSTMRKLTGTDPKTLRKWIGLFYSAIELLEPVVVSFWGSLDSFDDNHLIITAFDSFYCLTTTDSVARSIEIRPAQRLSSLR